MIDPLKAWLEAVLLPPTQEEIDAMTPGQRILSGIPTDATILIGGKAYHAKGLRLTSLSLGGEETNEDAVDLKFIFKPLDETAAG